VTHDTRDVTHSTKTQMTREIGKDHIETKGLDMCLLHAQFDPNLFDTSLRIVAGRDNEDSACVTKLKPRHYADRLAL
jgi:hypothetical protein